jgi:hypothetical protein
MLILLIISRPLHAQLPPYEKCTVLNTLQRMADDKTIKKDKAPQQRGDDENPDDDNLNDELNEHNDSDIDLEDIPDDFYDYQEEENL